MRAVVLCAYGVHPPRSAGHLAVLSPLRRLADHGHRFTVCTYGWRRGDGLWPRTHRRGIGPGILEHRFVDRLRLLHDLSRGRSRLPPLDLSESFDSLVPPEVLEGFRKADLWWTEGPWGFAFARRHAQGPVGFVVHNVEADLHGEALEKTGGPGFRARALEVEGRAFREADFVWVFHEEDARRMRTLYGEPRGRPPRP